VSSGHLVYATLDGNLSAVPFDVAALRVSGDAVLLVSGIRRSQNLFIGVANFSVAGDGTLLYLETVPQKPRTLVWVNRQGVEEPVDAPDSLYRGVRISPDGTRMAIDDGSSGGDIWVQSLSSGARTLLTVGDLGGNYPIWLDNQRLAYADGSRVLQTAANVSAPIPIIERPPEVGISTPYFIAPDGAMIVRSEGDTIARFSDGVRDPDWRLSGSNATLSPTGRWMAYESNESGNREVYVGPFPDVEAERVTVSAGGGFQPVWSADGRELFYLQGGGRLSPDRLVVATVDASGPTFEVTGRRQLLDFRPYRSVTIIRGYDVARDGRFLLIIERPGDDDASARLTRLVIVQHWLDQVTRLAPPR
jgi:serine/threonine-protein kinase